MLGVDREVSPEWKKKITVEEDIRGKEKEVVPVADKEISPIPETSPVKKVKIKFKKTPKEKWRKMINSLKKNLLNNSIVRRLQLTD